MEGCEHSKGKQLEKVFKSKERVNFMSLGLAYKEALDH